MTRYTCPFRDCEAQVIAEPEESFNMLVQHVERVHQPKSTMWMLSCFPRTVAPDPPSSRTAQ